jgi:hypothetical protein
MNNPPSKSEGAAPNPEREEMLSALFANMVIQQTNMAMMLLGKVAHPETGQFMQDIDSARMFIDQLEMLEAKTKGNLNKQEEGLLKQALSALQMAFVEAVDGVAGEKPPAPKEAAPTVTPAAPPAPDAAKPPVAEATPAEESRKKFSKKY